MARFSNARFATLLAIALALLMSGMAAGAAGQALIIGFANQGGTSNTSLDTTSSGFAWQMYQHGNGVGVFAISDNGVALAGLAHNGNQHALSVTNDGAAGTGAAIIADGKNNTAADLRVNSNAIPPLKVNSTAKVVNLHADELDGFGATAFMGDTVVAREAATSTGTLLGDGTRIYNQSCNAGEVLLSGGPANIDAGTILLESFPFGTSTWRARIQNDGSLDSFNVVVLCASR